MLQTVQIISQQATMQVNKGKPDIEIQAFTKQKNTRLHRDSVLSNTNQSMTQSPQHTIIGTGIYESCNIRYINKIHNIPQINEGLDMML